MARRRRRRPALSRAQRAQKVDDYYRNVADTLIERMQDGKAVWTQAWEPGAHSLPYNFSTGKPYRGGNTVWLAEKAAKLGYGDPRWGTFKQALDKGGAVRKGEKGTQILFWQFESRKLARGKDGRPLRDADGEPVYETRALKRPRVYPYTVFNAEQCDGLPARTKRRSAETWDPVEKAEKALKHSGAAIQHSGDDRAYYDLARDRIILPYRDQFPNASSYYQTALHELGHWTGHPERLNRETLVRGTEAGFWSTLYAREELRAEISSMMTGDRLNLGHDPSRHKRHAGYVRSWVRALRDDPREIYRAAKDAQEMSDWVLDRVRERTAQLEAAAPGAGAGEPAARPPEPAPAPEAPPPPPPLPRPPPEPEVGEQYRLFQRARLPSAAELSRSALRGGSLARGR